MKNKLNLVKKLGEMINQQNNTDTVSTWITIEQLPTHDMIVKWLCDDGIEDVGFYYSEHK